MTIKVDSLAHTPQSAMDVAKLGYEASIKYTNLNEVSYKTTICESSLLHAQLLMSCRETKGACMSTFAFERNPRELLI